MAHVTWPNHGFNQKRHLYWHLLDDDGQMPREVLGHAPMHRGDTLSTYDQVTQRAEVVHGALSGWGVVT